jgi:hypothetical protein
MELHRHRDNVLLLANDELTCNAQARVIPIHAVGARCQLQPRVRRLWRLRRLTLKLREIPVAATDQLSQLCQRGAQV